MKILLASIAVFSLVGASASAQEFQDQDTLLVDAAASPRAGTVRASLGGGGTAVSGGGTSSALVSVLYAGSGRSAFGFQAYEESGTPQPSVMMRYQLLSQYAHGVDLAMQARYKKVGFANDGGEVEASVNVGRHWGGLDAVLDAVYGHETDSAGSDLEGKASVGWSFTSRLRTGFDARLQAQASDGGHDVADAGALPGGRKFDFLAGPTVAWEMFDSVRVQALVGVGAPKGTTSVGPAGLLLASFDF